MDKLPLVIFLKKSNFLKKSRVELLICQNNSYYQNLGLLWGECLIMGKRGSFFWLLIIFTLGLSLLVSKHVWLT
jgi:hypothetical protein